MVCKGKKFFHDHVWKGFMVGLCFSAAAAACFSYSMRKLNLGRSTRSIYLGLACLSLALHLLLAFFCLSVLQTACILPSSSVPQADTLRRESISQSPTSSAASSLHPSPPTIPRDEAHHKLNAKTSHANENDSFAKKEKKSIGAGKAIEKVKSHDKLEALFKHRLYNLPHPELEENDWLLRVKPNVRSTGSEKKEKDYGILSDSEW